MSMVDHLKNLSVKIHQLLLIHLQGILQQLIRQEKEFAESMVLKNENS